MSCAASVSKIVIACCVLHNIAIRNGIDLDVDERPFFPAEEEAGEEDRADGQGVRAHYRGIRVREDIVQAYFRQWCDFYKVMFQRQ